MYLAWLELVDYRCYERLRFEPEEGINVLVGTNGAGKTSLLEAVGYLGTMKSLRSVPDQSLIREGAESTIVRGGLGGGATEMTVEVDVPIAGRRRVLVNGKRPSRLRDLLTTVPIVAFLPDDLDIVKRGPARRREYLDDLAARLWPQASADQSDYDRALRQRNTLLRQDGVHVDPVTLDVWDERLIAAGVRVMMHRRAVAAALQGHLVEAYRTVGGAGSLGWGYRSSWGSEHSMDVDELVAAFAAALAGVRRKDTELRTTTVGPHRDEPDVMIDGRDTRTRASQGEQRTAVLALRVGAYRLVQEIRSQTPILLLDDVFSELDADRARRVLELMPAGQVFVTTARDDEVPVKGRRWAVADGKVA